MEAKPKINISILCERFKKNGFRCIPTLTAEEAKNKILEIIPLNASVGVANSVTLRQLNVLKHLQERGNHIIDPISPLYEADEFNIEAFRETLRKTVDADVFLSGTNAVTEDGKLVNIDGVGNRVAGIFWNLGTSIVVVGKNKIVKDAEKALYRIKNTIAPTLVKRRQLRLPCAQAGKCVDCDSRSRICNITVILDRKPPFSNITLIIVDEDMGLGWAPEWPSKRIEKVRKDYERFDGPYVFLYQLHKK